MAWRKFHDQWAIWTEPSPALPISKMLSTPSMSQCQAMELAENWSIRVERARRTKSAAAGVALAAVVSVAARALRLALESSWLSAIGEARRSRGVCPSQESQKERSAIQAHVGLDASPKKTKPRRL